MADLLTKYMAVIGAGNIGRIIVERLLAVGLPHDHLVVCDRDDNRAQSMAEEYALRPVTLPDESICSANILFIAVSPKAVLSVLRTLSKWLCPKELVIAYDTAIPLEKLETAAGGSIPMVRIMPKAASSVGKDMNLVAYGRFVTLEGRVLTEEILALLEEKIYLEAARAAAEKIDKLQKKIAA